MGKGEGLGKEFVKGMEFGKGFREWIQEKKGREKILGWDLGKGKDLGKGLELQECILIPGFQSLEWGGQGMDLGRDLGDGFGKGFREWEGIWDLGNGIQAGAGSRKDGDPWKGIQDRGGIWERGKCWTNGNVEQKLGSRMDEGGEEIQERWEFGTGI